jgi:acetoin utilization protein AcuB
MQVQRWMTQPVVTVHEDCPAVLAFRKMHEHQIRRLPVVDEDGALVGIVADRDLRGAALAVMNGDSAQGDEEKLVRDFMTREVITVTPKDDVRDAALTMLSNRFTGLPVMDGGKLVGMITVTDLMEILVGALERIDRAKA